MHAADVSLIKESFRKVLPIADKAAALFYARLFELNPASRSRCRGEMCEQREKHLAHLARLVASLEHPETLARTACLSGAPRAFDRGDAAHGAAMASALIWTLEKSLGPEFTPAIRHAWLRAYALLSTHLVQTTPHATLAA